MWQISVDVALTGILDSAEENEDVEPIQNTEYDEPSQRPPIGEGDIMSIVVKIKRTNFEGEVQKKRNHFFLHFFPFFFLACFVY